MLKPLSLNISTSHELKETCKSKFDEIAESFWRACWKEWKDSVKFVYPETWTIGKFQKGRLSESK